MNSIETVRVNLRRLQKFDLKNMIELETDPQIMKFTPSRFALSEEKIEVRLNTWINKESTYSPLGIWMAELKADKTFVGWFMLLKANLDYPELGFMIARKQWGKGLASEISAKLIQYGLETLNLEKIFARTDEENKVSKRVLEKIGLHLTEVKSSYDTVLQKEVKTCLYEICKNL